MNSVKMYQLDREPSCSYSDNESTYSADEYDSGDDSKRRMRGEVKKREAAEQKAAPLQKPIAKTTRGRLKIDNEFIKDTIRRRQTFSKRRISLMNKVKKLAVLTGTQVLFLVASETGDYA